MIEPHTLFLQKNSVVVAWLFSWESRLLAACLVAISSIQGRRQGGGGENPLMIFMYVEFETPETPDIQPEIDFIPMIFQM